MRPTEIRLETWFQNPERRKDPQDFARVTLELTAIQAFEKFRVSFSSFHR
jgi:hypothetical protein